MVEDFMKVLKINGTPTPLINTEFATLWRIARPGGDLVIKHFKPGVFKDEAPGLDYCRAKAATGHAISILEIAEDLCLMPYLDGPTLGNQARSGDLIAADRELAWIGKRLQAVDHDYLKLPHVADWYRDLFSLRYAPDCPADLNGNMHAAAETTKSLLAEISDPVALHGDLHHDNVIRTQMGTSAIDAKGVYAPPAFEASNALRNPEGLSEQFASIDLQRQRTQIYAEYLDRPPCEIAAWAATRCALSIAWCANGLQAGDSADSQTLSILMYLAREFSTQPRK